MKLIRLLLTNREIKNTNNAGDCYNRVKHTRKLLKNGKENYKIYRVNLISKSDLITKMNGIFRLKNKTILYLKLFRLLWARFV